MKEKSKFVLILIIFLASILRLFDLTDFPAGLNADEAAIGYNAYSLLETGKDEYGNPFPLVFKSFGDFKPGLYFYFVMPFVKFLGLSELAVRLPSALLGIATVFLIYLLGKQIFKSEAVGLLSALLLAISPWHLHFSRGGWESNAATFFITLGVLLFLGGLENSKQLFFSFLSFLTAMYVYQSPRLTVPLFLVGLALLYRQKLWKVVKRVPKFLLILAAVLAVPLALQFTSGGGSARFSGLSFLSDTGPAMRVNELRGEHYNPGGKMEQLLHNKLTAYGPAFLGHYLDHFKPNFLFINGDEVIRNKVPETGQFYLIWSVFLVLGLVGMVKNNFGHFKLLLVWIITAPLASSITFQTPNALRSLSLVIPLTLVMGYGLWVAGKGVAGTWRYLVISVAAVFLLFEFVHYLESYYVHYPRRYPLAWEYGFEEMVGKLSKYEGEYQKVVITDRYDQPYILVLFYKQYNPRKYQPQALLSPRDKFNFGTVRGFDKYEFRKIESTEVKNAQGVLYIGTGEEIPGDANIIDKVNFPDGKPAFIFAKT